ncbi:MAG: hypothetical protein Q7S23_04180 [bacterium]|nr:hypothetical protein [bacterium]
MFRTHIVTVTLVTFALIAARTLPTHGQTVVAYGENRVGSLSCGYDDPTPIATYRFTANEDDRFVAIVTECSDSGGVCNATACFCFDQCINVLDPDGMLAMNNCSPRGGNNATQRYRTRVQDILFKAGTYSITITDGDRTGEGTYTLFIQRTNQPGRAEPLFSGDVLVITQATCGGVDTYTFAGLEGQIADIVMSPNTGSLKPRLELYDPLGRSIALPGNGTVHAPLPRDGAYTVLAYSAVDETGTYRISFTLSTVFVRGDANDDGALNIGDPIHIFNLLFLENRPFGCREAANGNNDAGVDISDGVYLLSFLFLGGPPPATPAPACGADPDPIGSPGDLGCERYQHCP